MAEETIKETAKYELSYLISPQLKEEEILNCNQGIEKLIIEQEGQIENKISPKKQNLAYLVKHQRDGYFGILNFIFPPQNLEKLSSALRLNDKVLRFMITKPEISRKPAKKRRIMPAAPKVAAPKEEKSYKKKIELEELDKKLEEILGKEEL